MKFSPAFYEVKKFYVAPLVGARIEISMGLTEVDLAKVAPLVGARIEIA